MNTTPTGVSDAQFIEQSGLWPQWPFLPVKRYIDKELKIGIIMCTDPKTVHELNLHAGWTEEQFESAPAFVYESVEELVADGWMVD